MEMIIKNFSVESKAVDVEAGIYEAMISTESVDRVGDVVRATGAKLDNYLKNPVVLWSHDYSSPPVAKSLSLEIMPGYGIKATFQFPPRGASAQADTIHNLWAGKFINATSIGFMPIDSKDLAKDDGSFSAPQDYVSWELLEFSLVPVPANQNALRLAMKTLEPPIEKRGRVLSSANEGKLRRAAEIINEVLAQVGDEPQQDALNDSTAEPSTNPTSNNVSEAEQTQIAEKLTHIFGAWIKD
jgi:HK97 family phage prohead protease